MRNNFRPYEEKWHAELCCILSVNFWDKCWKLQSSIKYNNKGKWLQCQILRHCIYTNNRLAKFKPEIIEACDFCSTHFDRPISLFFTCEIVQDYWAELSLYLSGFNITLPISRLKIIFGVLEESAESCTNTCILIGKQVIWMCKNQQINPSIVIFKNVLKDYLVVLQYCQKLEFCSDKFNRQWGELLNNLQNGS